MSTRTPALQLPLPGTWWSLPMTTQDELAASVKELVRRQFGRRDDQATVRAQQRERLVRGGERALAGGATQFHLSLKDAAGLAYASTAAEYRPELPLGAMTDAAVVADALVRALASRDDPRSDPESRWDVFAASGGVAFAKGDGLVLRQNRTVAGDDPEDPPAVVVDYWLTEPGRARAVLVTFSTALAELQPLFLELFDAIVSRATWRESEGAGSLRAELLGESDPNDGE